MNTCIDCNKPIYCKSKRCHSCSNKFRWKNVLYKQRVNAEISKKRKGQCNYHKGKITLKQYYCIQCGAKISCITFLYSGKRCRQCACNNRVGQPIHTEQQKQVYRRRMLGKNNPRYKLGGTNRFKKGHKIYTPTQVEYKGIKMRSSWEAKYAQMLDRHNIKWQYESKKFDLKDCTYTPDFYLPIQDKYIEIKGYMTDYAKRKIHKFKILYPNIQFEILQFKELKSLKVL